MIENAAYADVVEEQHEDDQLTYNSMCENIFAEIARQWLDQNGGRIVADIMAQKKQPARRRTVLSDEKYPVPPF